MLRLGQEDAGPGERVAVEGDEVGGRQRFGASDDSGHGGEASQELLRGVGAPKGLHVDAFVALGQASALGVAYQGQMRPLGRRVTQQPVEICLPGSRR